MTDMVNHPPHYTFGGIEVLDAIEAWELGYHLGNVVKYVARAKHKGNELEDLKKARFYLDRKIGELSEVVTVKVAGDTLNFAVGEQLEFQFNPNDKAPEPKYRKRRLPDVLVRGGGEGAWYACRSDQPPATWADHWVDVYYERL